MVYIIKKSGSDFQQGGCLYKPTSGIRWTLEHWWTSDRPQKLASVKANQSAFGSSVVVIINRFIDGAIDVLVVSLHMLNSYMQIHET